MERPVTTLSLSRYQVRRGSRALCTAPNAWSNPIHQLPAVRRTNDLPHTDRLVAPALPSQLGEVIAEKYQAFSPTTIRSRHRRLIRSCWTVAEPDEKRRDRCGRSRLQRGASNRHCNTEGALHLPCHYGRQTE